MSAYFEDPQTGATYAPEEMSDARISADRRLYAQGRMIATADNPTARALASAEQDEKQDVFRRWSDYMTEKGVEVRNLEDWDRLTGSLIQSPQQRLRMQPYMDDILKRFAPPQVQQELQDREKRDRLAKAGIDAAVINGQVIPRAQLEQMQGAEPWRKLERMGEFTTQAQDIIYETAKALYSARFDPDPETSGRAEVTIANFEKTYGVKLEDFFRAPPKPEPTPAPAGMAFGPAAPLSPQEARAQGMVQTAPGVFEPATARGAQEAALAFAESLIQKAKASGDANLVSEAEAHRSEIMAQIEGPQPQSRETPSAAAPSSATPTPATETQPFRRATVYDAEGYPVVARERNGVFFVLDEHTGKWQPKEPGALLRRFRQFKNWSAFLANWDAKAVAEAVRPVVKADVALARAGKRGVQEIDKAREQITDFLKRFFRSATSE